MSVAYWLIFMATASYSAPLEKSLILTLVASTRLSAAVIAAHSSSLNWLCPIFLKSGSMTVAWLSMTSTSVAILGISAMGVLRIGGPQPAAARLSNRASASLSMG